MFTTITRVLTGSILKYSLSPCMWHTSTHHSQQLQLRNSSSSGSRGGCTSSPCWFITNHSFANWDWSSFVAAYWRQMKITHLSHKIEPTEMMFGCLNEFGSVLVGWFGESMRIGESCDTSFILPLKLTKRYINRYLHIIFYIFIHPLHRNPFGTNNILQSFFIYHFPTAPWSGFQLPTNPPRSKIKKSSYPPYPPGGNSNPKPPKPRKKKSTDSTTKPPSFGEIDALILILRHFLNALNLLSDRFPKMAFHLASLNKGHSRFFFSRGIRCRFFLLMMTASFFGGHMKVWKDGRDEIPF